MARLHRAMGPLLLLLPLLLLAATASPRTSAAGGPDSRCICQTSSCLCCVELDLSASIDLGGPTCINLRQVQRNVSLNLSYGDNPVHNATIALDLAANRPTCMNLLSDLAQICARFVSMRAPQAGERAHEGCLVVEPALLGAPQATYPVGCFLFEQGRVQQANSSEPLNGSKEQQAQAEPEDEEEEPAAALNAQDLIAVVSAGAEQGIALFSQWLGLNLYAPGLNVSGVHNRTSANQHQQPSAAAASRQSRTVPLFLPSEDKGDERFKLILSAQDNIFKEPAAVGGSSTAGLPTAFLYSQPNAEETIPSQDTAAAITISPDNLAIVPYESRRGGRAYNIHQHVNEV